MSNKTFTVAGWSTLNGKIKGRVANDILRMKTLEKNDHVDIVLHTLPTAMSKLDAMQWLLGQGFVMNDETQAAIQGEVARLQPKQAKADATEAAPAAEPEEPAEDVEDEEIEDEEIEDEGDDEYDAVAEEDEDFVEA